MKPEHKRCPECGLTWVGSDEDYKKHQEGHGIAAEVEKMKKHIRDSDRKCLIRDYAGLALQGLLANHPQDYLDIRSVTKNAVDLATALADAVLESEG